MMKSILICLAWITMVLSGSSQGNWHVYVFLAEECPVCNYMGNPLNDIAQKYEGRVDFYAVFPFKNSNYKSAQLFKEQYEMQSFETFMDKDKSLTKKLGATVTPEAVVTDDQGNVYYRGRINSAYYAPGKMKHGSIKNDLDEALEILLNGGVVPQPWPSPVGCYITMDAPR